MVSLQLPVKCNKPLWQVTKDGLMNLLLWFSSLDLETSEINKNDIHPQEIS